MAAPVTKTSTSDGSLPSTALPPQALYVKPPVTNTDLAMTAATGLCSIGYDFLGGVWSVSTQLGSLAVNSVKPRVASYVTPIVVDKVIKYLGDCLDEKQIQYDMEVLAKLTDGQVLRTAIDLAGPKLCEILCQTSDFAKVKDSPQSKSQFIQLIRSLLLRAVANIIEQTPGENKSFATVIRNLLNITQYKVKLHIREAQDLDFQIQSLTTAIKKLDPKKNSTEHLKQLEALNKKFHLLLQEMAMPIVNNAFPKGISNGNEMNYVQTKIWEQLLAALPTLVEPFYRLFVEPKAADEKEQKEYSKEKDKKDNTSLVKTSTTISFQIKGGNEKDAKESYLKEKANENSDVIIWSVIKLISNTSIDLLYDRFGQSTEGNQKTLATLVAGIGKDFLLKFATINMKEEEEKKYKETHSEHFVPAATSITKTLQVLANSGTLKEFIKSQIEPLLTKALGHVASSKKNNSDPFTEIVEAIKPLIIGIYYKHGQKIREQYLKIASLESNDTNRAAWINEIFTSATDKLCYLAKLETLLSERDPKNHFKILTLIKNEFPGWLFELYGLLIRKEPGLAAWIHPEEANNNLQELAASLDLGPLYLYLTNFIVDMIMKEIPKNLDAGMADTIADKLMTAFCTMFRNEMGPSKEELTHWLAAEIRKVRPGTCYEAVYNLIRSQASAIVIKIIARTNPAQNIVDLISIAKKELNVETQKHLADLNEQLTLCEINKNEDQAKILLEKLSGIFQPISRALLETFGITIDPRLSIGGLNKTGGQIELAFASYLAGAYRQLILPAQKKTALGNELNELFFDGQLYPNIKRDNLSPKGLNEAWRDIGIIQQSERTFNSTKALAAKITDAIRNALKTPATSNSSAEVLYNFLKPQPVKKQKEDKEQKEAKELQEREAAAKKHLSNEIQTFSSSKPGNDSEAIWQYVEDLIADSILPNALLNFIQKAQFQEKDRKDQVGILQIYDPHAHIEPPKHRLYYLPEKIISQLLSIMSGSLKSFDVNAKIEADEKGVSQLGIDHKPIAKRLLEMTDSSVLSPVPLIPQTVKDKFWKDQLPSIIADYMDKTHREIDRRKEARLVQAKGVEIYQTKYLDPQTRNYGFRPFEELSRIMNNFIRDRLPVLLTEQNLMEDFVRKAILPYLPFPPEQEAAVTKWLVDNFKTLGESKGEGINAVKSFAGNLVEPLLLKALGTAVDTLHRIETKPANPDGKHDSSFMVDEIIKTMTGLNEHLKMVNEITSKLGYSQPYKVPKEEMEKEFGNKLHPSMAPGRDIPDFFSPLFINLLKITGLTEKDMPVPAALQKTTYKTLVEQGPLLLRALYNQMSSEYSLNGIKLSLIKKIKNAFGNMEKTVKDLAPLDELEKKITSSFEKMNIILKKGIIPDQTQQTIPELKKVLEEAVKALTDLNNPCQKALNAIIQEMTAKLDTFDNNPGVEAKALLEKIDGLLKESATKFKTAFEDAILHEENEKKLFKACGPLLQQAVTFIPNTLLSTLVESVEMVRNASAASLSNATITYINTNPMMKMLQTLVIASSSGIASSNNIRPEPTTPDGLFVGMEMHQVNGQDVPRSGKLLTSNELSFSFPQTKQTREIAAQLQAKRQLALAEELQKNEIEMGIEGFDVIASAKFIQLWDTIQGGIDAAIDFIFCSYSGPVKTGIKAIFWCIGKILAGIFYLPYKLIHLILECHLKSKFEQFEKNLSISVNESFLRQRILDFTNNLVLKKEELEKHDKENEAVEGPAVAGLEGGLGGAMLPDSRKEGEVSRSRGEGERKVRREEERERKVEKDGRDFSQFPAFSSS